MKFFRALCSQVLNTSKDGEQKITGVHVAHKTVIFLGFSILIQGLSKIQCAPRGMLETSLTSKQEQKKEIHSDCPCSRTGRKGGKEWDRVYFSMILIMCVIEDGETHQSIANVVKVDVWFWDTKFRIRGLNQQNKEPLCLSYTSAINFLIMTRSYHSVSKSVSQIFKGRTPKYLGLYCFQATDLKLLTPMGLKNHFLTLLL